MIPRARAAAQSSPHPAAKPLRPTARDAPGAGRLITIVLPSWLRLVKILPLHNSLRNHRIRRRNGRSWSASVLASENRWRPGTTHAKRARTVETGEWRHLLAGQGVNACRHFTDKSLKDRSLIALIGCACRHFFVGRSIAMFVPGRPRPIGPLAGLVESHRSHRVADR